MSERKTDTTSHLTLRLCHESGVMADMDMQLLALRSINFQTDNDMWAFINAELASFGVTWNPLNCRTEILMIEGPK